LVVWNMNFILPYVICIGNVIIPTDFPLIDHIYIHNPNYIPIYSIYQHNLSIIGSYWIPTDFHSMIFQSGRWLNHQAVLDDMNLRSSRRGRLFSMTLRVNHFGWLKNLCTTEVWNIWYLPHEIYKSIFLQKIYFCCCAYWIFLDV
jgi:hypothetical protein